eukprot:3607134-Rhodomonas_salina.1
MEAKQLNPDAVLSLLNPLLKDAKGVPGPAQDTALLHVASVASILIANINFEPPVWSELVDQTLAPFFGAEEVKNVGTQLRELCFKETRPKAVQVRLSLLVFEGVLRAEVWTGWGARGVGVVRARVLGRGGGLSLIHI